MPRGKSIAYLNSYFAKRGEGWGLFDVDSTGLIEIEKDDELGKFKWDDGAVAFVRRKAKAGSRLHQQALAIHRKYRPALNEMRRRRWGKAEAGATTDDCARASGPHHKHDGKCGGKD